MKTGGLPAEYGRMTGGVINVITKSRRQHVQRLGLRLQRGRRAACRTTRPRTIGRQTTTTVTEPRQPWDVGGRRSAATSSRTGCGSSAPTTACSRRPQTTRHPHADAPGSPAHRQEIPTDRPATCSPAKLTYRLGSGQRLVGAVNGDPATREGDIFAIAGPRSTWDGEQKTGAHRSGRAPTTAVFGGTFILRALVGRHNEKSEYSRRRASDIAAVIDQTVSPNIRTGGFGGSSRIRSSRATSQGRRDQVPRPATKSRRASTGSTSGQLDRPLQRRRRHQQSTS